MLNEDNCRGDIHLLESDLRALPKDLHRLFENSLQGDGDRKNALLPVFTWVLFVERPLRPEELYLALINESEDVFLHWDRLELSTTDN